MGVSDRNGRGPQKFSCPPPQYLKPPYGPGLFAAIICNSLPWESRFIDNIQSFKSSLKTD